MNTTAKSLLGGLALLAAGHSAAAHAGSQSIALHAVLTAATVGQSQSANKQADDLLKQARKEIDSGNLEQADTLIGKAEKLNPQYNTFYLGDTPKKAREDLKKKLAARTAPSRSGFGLLGSKEPPKDPFSARRDATNGESKSGAKETEAQPQPVASSPLNESEAQRGSAYGSASIRLATEREDSNNRPSGTAGSAYGAAQGPAAAQSTWPSAAQLGPRMLSPAQGNAVNPGSPAPRPAKHRFHSVRGQKLSRRQAQTLSQMQSRSRPRPRKTAQWNFRDRRAPPWSVVTWTAHSDWQMRPSGLASRIAPSVRATSVPVW